eukprot:CAMPEP_0170613130 /NCGR_PEP_ID=MMETSP0224-20130122/24106_1 /TAXON_ID=285029 /ORGANISM="Togula jolla, Strain CCCM 725" /LENGTH=348 /DNA_ID=CAMNT_0010938707 /DNA_START=77 /DNA_END=1123 /DNA_ORIENTATION=+
MNTEEVYSSVKEYYGEVLKSSSDLKTSACCTLKAPHPTIEKILDKVPDEIKDKYYGCGTPLPFGIEGLSVLDLGSGSGRDCYVAAGLVGPKGSVYGVDMTPAQLSVAEAHVEEYTKTLGYDKPNLHFRNGYIEFLEKAGIQPNSMDIVISNCVINLSPNKRLVMEEVYKCLREGGELYFSDVYCSRRLPESARKDPVLFGECIGGALYTEDFKRICRQVGFEDPRVLSVTPFEIFDRKLKDLVGEAKFYSITYRCFKLPQLESICEDYGQVAIYLGTIPEHKFSYALDDHHVLETNKPMLVCGNTASMLGETWLKAHFRIIGDRSVHYGAFDCGSGPAPTAAAGGSCC